MTRYSPAIRSYPVKSASCGTPSAPCTGKARCPFLEGRMGSPASQRDSLRLEVTASKAPALNQRQHGLGLEARPPHQVPRSCVGAMPLPLLHDELPRALPHVLDELETQQDAALVGDAFHLAQIYAGVEEGHAESPGILLERLQGVEAHGLVVHQRDEELQGMVALEPGGLVGRDGEGVRVGLGEHVVPIDLGEYPLRHILWNAVALSPFQGTAPCARR